MITGYLETKADPMTHFHFYISLKIFSRRKGERKYKGWCVLAWCSLQLKPAKQAKIAKSEQRFIPPWRWDCCSYAWYRATMSFSVTSYVQCQLQRSLLCSRAVILGPHELFILVVAWSGLITEPSGNSDSETRIWPEYCWLGTRK